MQSMIRRHRPGHRKQVRPDAPRHREVEAGQRHLRVLGARGIDHERAEAVAALQRALRDVGVLDPRPRHVGRSSASRRRAESRARLRRLRYDAKR